MNYFKDCKTPEEAKKKFREMAMKLHPDHGGNKEDMIDLHRQYEAFDTHDFNKFSRSSTMNEEEFNNSFNRAYTSYGAGGYQYRTSSDMHNEYKRQTSDPRLADYERMKTNFDYFVNRHDKFLAENIELKKENEALKKKLERLKKKLNPASKPPSKKKKKDSESVISL